MPAGEYDPGPVPEFPDIKDFKWDTGSEPDWSGFQIVSKDADGRTILSQPSGEQLRWRIELLMAQDEEYQRRQEELKAQALKSLNATSVIVGGVYVPGQQKPIRPFGGPRVKPNPLDIPTAFPLQYGDTAWGPSPLLSALEATYDKPTSGQFPLPPTVVPAELSSPLKNWMDSLNPGTRPGLPPAAPGVHPPTFSEGQISSIKFMMETEKATMLLGLRPEALETKPAQEKVPKLDRPRRVIEL